MEIEKDGFEEEIEQADNEEIVAESQDDSMEETNEEVTAEPTEEVETKEDITTTQAFSKRLKEATEKARQEAVDQEYDRLYGEEYNIHSKAEYDAAIAEQNRQAEIEELSRSVSPEVAKEIQENREFRKKYEAEQTTKAEQAKKEKNYEEFLTEYPDVKADEIPVAVWQEVEKGKSLVDAYARNEVKTLRERLKVFEKNESNSKKSPVGGVSIHGSKEEAEDDPFIKGFDSY